MIIKNCLQCNKKFSSKSCSKRKFCSFVCYRKTPILDSTRLKMSNSHKNNPVKYWLGKKQTKDMCNKKAEKMIGNKHLIGKTWVVLSRRNPFKSLMTFLRGTTNMNEWRKGVYAKDNWTCKICGVRGYTLQADHIKPFSIIFQENKIKSEKQAYDCKELWDINNGRTLCLNCHKKTDTYGGKAKRLNRLVVNCN